MPDSRNTFTVITHRALSNGADPSVGYTKRDAMTFDASTSIGEIVDWATGDKTDGPLESLSGISKRTGLHLIEIVIPPQAEN